MQAALKHRIEIASHSSRLSEADVAEICFESFLPILENRDLFRRLENVAEREGMSLPELILGAFTAAEIFFHAWQPLAENVDLFRELEALAESQGIAIPPLIVSAISEYVAARKKGGKK
jgi:hypothetical protein